MRHGDVGPTERREARRKPVSFPRASRCSVRPTVCLSIAPAARLLLILFPGSTYSARPNQYAGFPYPRIEVLNAEWCRADRTQ